MPDRDGSRRPSWGGGEIQFNEARFSTAIHQAAGSMEHTSDATYRIPMPETPTTPQQPLPMQTTCCHECGADRIEDSDEGHTFVSHEVGPARWFCEDCMYRVSECDNCHTFGHDRGFRTLGHHQVCRDCVGVARHCEACQLLTTVDDMTRRGGIRMCVRCSRTMRDCVDCGAPVTSGQRRIRSDEGVDVIVCQNCFRADERRFERRNVEYQRARSRKAMPFGTEIEVEFSEERSFELSGYHSGRPAPAPFFGGWKAESDGSLSYNGAELVSPILEGAGGVAEVIATMKTLRDMNGVMKASCGGHVTVSVANRTTALKCQQLFTFLEEAAYATTAAYGRYIRGSYASTLKRSCYRDLREGYSSNEKFLALHNKTDCVEYRYAPGTLVPEQFAINVGLSQLITKVGTNLKTSQVKELLDQTVPMWENVDHGPYASEEKIHRFVMYGLNFLRSFGWRAKGEFNGLPYNPNNPPCVKVKDGYRGRTDEVQLPNAQEILLRYERQVNRFYMNMFRNLNENALRDVWRADALSLIHNEPTERALELTSSSVKVPNEWGIYPRPDEEDRGSRYF